MTLKRAIETKNVPEIRNIIKKKTSAEICHDLDLISPKLRLRFFRLNPSKNLSDIFADLDSKHQEELIKQFTNEELKDIVGELHSDDIADITEEIPVELASRILRATKDPSVRDRVNKILRYNDNQTGSMMTMDIILLKQTFNVGDAIEHIKKNRERSRLAHYFFIVDSKQKLVGNIALEELLFANKNDSIKKYSKPVSNEIKTTTEREDAIIIFAREDMSVLPVSNTSGQVIGMVFADDILDAVHEEAEDDFKKIAGISGKSRTLTYSKSTVFDFFKERILWLSILVITSTFSSLFIDIFQNIANDKLSTALSSSLVVIVPVIMGAAGNAGNQSSTTIIRAFATGDIKQGEYLRVLKKEVMVASLVGVVLAIINFLRLMVYFGAKGELGDTAYIYLSLITSLSLFLIIVISKFIGTVIPLLAKIIKSDAATFAGPIIQTIMDIIATVILFSVSILIMVQIGVV